MTRKARKPDDSPVQPARSTTTSVLPMNLQVGDRFTVEGFEWQVLTLPRFMLGGKNMRVRIARPGVPETEREMIWAAYQRITVRRGPAST